MVQSPHDSSMELPLDSGIEGSGSGVTDGPSPLGNGHSNGAASNGHPSNGVSNGSNGSMDSALAIVKRHTDAMDYDGDAGFKAMYPGSQLDRREFVRLTLQALTDMGYNDTAAALSAESGFLLETPAVAAFRKGVLEGRWGAVLDSLGEFTISNAKDLARIKFIVNEQRFLEALEAGETKKALAILRNELTPLMHNQERLHLLSSFMMCNGPEDLRVRAGWDGAAGTSRSRVLNDLQACIPPSTMIPQRRMETLLEQARAHQRKACIYHADDVPISLYADCKCDPSVFPTITTQVLRDHTDEVWRLRFSHNGEWLATTGKDMTTILWRVKDHFRMDKVLREHTDPIGCLAFSPDDSVLLTAAEGTIKMWNVESGVCLSTLDEHEHTVGALCWQPDGKGFVSGGMDARVLLWDLSGKVIWRWTNLQSRVMDLVISPDGTKLVSIGRRAVDLRPHADPLGSASPASTSSTVSGTEAVSNQQKVTYEHRISVVKLPEKEVLYEIAQPEELTSVSVSKDSKFALVSHAPNQILYLDLSNGTIYRTYTGHNQRKFVVKSCFGGPFENYVLSGSEDGDVFVWHRDTGRLLHRLQGHGSGAVNDVAWNRSSTAQFATASDDHTVRIWGIPSAPRGSTSNTIGDGMSIEL